jgi:hypothetical protein
LISLTGFVGQFCAQAPPTLNISAAAATTAILIQFRNA